MPTPSPRTTQDYMNAMLALLPSGKAWPKYVGSGMYNIILTWMPTFSRIDQAGLDFITEAFPGTSSDPGLLPDWEASLGLPDGCMVAPTIPQRQAAVMAKLGNRGGLNVPYYENYISTLCGGATITITEFSEFLAGISCGGDPVAGDETATCWQINCPSGYVSLVRCEIEKIKPANTSVAYNGT